MPETEAVPHMDVPFVDLAPSHEPLKEAILVEVSRLIDEGTFVNGPAVAAFEQQFAAYVGTAQCVGVGSGLDALRLSLLAAGLEPGDEVIVPAHTFVATVEAVEQAGAKPVLVDISELDYNLDVEAAAATIGSRTRLLLPVHLYGQMVDMPRLLDVAAAHDLLVVEDACQAHGASRNGARAGTAGFAAAFSFYPGKNLGAMGDAGAVVTNRADVAEHVVALREHGQRRKYDHEIPGWTARLDTIQATVLSQKLPLLDAWNTSRQKAAAFYTSALEEVGDLVLPPVPQRSQPVWHLYVVRTRDPEGLADYLRECGIASGRHYPKPVHLTEAYAHLGYPRGSFPVAEALAREVLSLPIFPGISDAQLDAVVEAVTAFFDG